jgi:hypothetical protein
LQQIADLVDEAERLHNIVTTPPKVMYQGDLRDRIDARRTLVTLDANIGTEFSIEHRPELGTIVKNLCVSHSWRVQQYEDSN